MFLHIFLSVCLLVNGFVSGAGGLRFKYRAGQKSEMRGRKDAKVSTANSFHAMAKYSEYNKRFALL